MKKFDRDNMKLGVLFVLLIAVALILPGCGAAANNLKHLQSSMIGLNRKITLYSANGEVIKTWSTKAKIEDHGGTVYFLDSKSKAITISGTFTVEEE